MSKSVLNDIAGQLTSGEISSVDLLNRYFSKIDKYDAKVKAFLEVEKDEAINAAKESDFRRKNGTLLSKYDGIPVGIKDNIVQKGRKSGCASKILEGFTSVYSATVIEKLTAKGFIPVGRLNMDEFAMGSSTENSAYQITRNPHDLERAPGGSSGGSAAAVSAGFLPVSLGSDTGGSIRQPAAFTGIVGLKPTYGTVSRFGLIAFASSLDQIGPFSRYVEDTKIIYEIIKGFDEKDSTSLPLNQYKMVERDIKNLKVGVPWDLIEGVSPEVKESFEAIIEFLKNDPEMNCEIIKVNMPHQKYGIPVYYLTATSEASANLARFDGVRYGRRAEKIKNLEQLYENSRTEGFGREVKRRILLGTYALSSGYYDAFYGKAQKVRTLIREDYVQTFKEVDLILMPTTPTPPFKIGEKSTDPVQMYLSDVLTVGASLAGVPAISVPSPFSKLPVGIQIQGNYFSENLIFKVASRIETAFPAAEPKLD